MDEDALEVLLALGGAGGDHLLDLRVPLGVEGGEGEVLELPAHLLHPEAVRQGRIDVEGLLGGAALLPLGHHGQGPHVVQPVGQLDQQDPPVLRHGDEHLADRRRLLRFLRVELQAVELGHPVDHLGHAVAEGRADGVEGQARVLHGVVEELGRHGLLVRVRARPRSWPPPSGVGDVRLPRTPELALVGPGGHPSGLDDGAPVVVGPVPAELPEEGREQVADVPQLLPAPARGLERSSRCLCQTGSPHWGHHPYRLPAREK